MIKRDKVVIKNAKERRKIITSIIGQRLLKESCYNASMQLAKKYPNIRGYFSSNRIELTNKKDKKYQKEFEKLVNENFLRLLDFMMNFILNNIELIYT